MEENKVVYEVRKTFTRVEEDKERIIFEKKSYDDREEWIYHAPNAQNHTESQVEDILAKLKELNKSKNGK